MKFMDLLSKRYADPCFLLDGYIRTGRLSAFIPKVFQWKSEDDRWNYYLHKVFDKSYEEFCDDVKTTEAHQNMSEKIMETTVKRSFDILGNFSPESPEKEGDE